ncbi:hypothetical protein [Streptomyces sp. NRRL F-2799]|uniref:hypothetical protein n=1 Tax=Streptomyces sp. NRRL F-2799 TaxID=1463844 RepID=UPI00068FADF7|nr:hypothetical protein [Streptomyces sp. NRRL F-2799]
MTVLPYTDIFVCLAHWVERCCADEMLCDHRGDCADAPPHMCLPVSALPDVVGRGAVDDALQTRVWEEIGTRLRCEEQRWALVAMWLLTPRLRGAAKAITRSTNAEVGDVCAALLSGMVEGAGSVGTASPDHVEEYLIDSAFKAGWRTGRRSPRESPTEDVDAVRGDQDVSETRTMPMGAEIVRVGMMSAALARRAQGERLGALAQRLGLMPHVRETRRLRRAGLKLSPLREPDVTAYPEKLFEIQEEVRSAAP